MHHFVSFVRPVFGESVLDLGSSTRELLRLLLERARPEEQSLSSDACDLLGPIIAVDIAERFKSLIVCNIKQVEPYVRLSYCMAGASSPEQSAVKIMIDQDLVDHTGELKRGEGRVYVGMGANFIKPDLMAHLAQKTPGGAGFDLITASHDLLHVVPALHATVLRQWASALAPGGRLVVQRALYHPHPDNEHGLTCPGQMISWGVADNGCRDPKSPLEYSQCAPDRYWQLCAQQLRTVATDAGLEVVRLEWSCHGGAEANNPRRFSNIWASEWEEELLRDAPGAPDYQLVELLCKKAKVVQLIRLLFNSSEPFITYNLVHVVAELKALN